MSTGVITLSRQAGLLKKSGHCFRIFVSAVPKNEAFIGTGAIDGSTVFDIESQIGVPWSRRFQTIVCTKREMSSVAGFRDPGAQTNRSFIDFFFQS